MNARELRPEARKLVDDSRCQVEAPIWCVASVVFSDKITDSVIDVTSELTESRLPMFDPNDTGPVEDFLIWALSGDDD